MVVHHVDAPPLPRHDMHTSLVFEVVRQRDPAKSWEVAHGPVSSSDWTASDLFGRFEPDGDLPPVRFEAAPNGEVVDVVSPVLNDTWLLKVALRRDGDDLVPVGIDLRPRPGATINATTLRSLGFGGVQRAANLVLLGSPAIAAHLGDRWARPVERPGRAGREDNFYAGWARRYVQARVEAPRRPVAHLIEQAAKRGEHVTRGEIAARLTVARQRGLLTEAPSGQPGGELTEQARQLLGLDEEGN